MARGEPQVQVSIRMPATHATALEKKAAEEDRTVSAEIRRLVRQYVSPVEPKEAA